MRHDYINAPVPSAKIVKRNNGVLEVGAASAANSSRINALLQKFQISLARFYLRHSRQFI